MSKAFIRIAQGLALYGSGGSLFVFLVEGFGGITKVETDGSLTIAGNTLTFPAQTTPAWGDLGFYGATRVRAAGLALAGILNLATWEECGLAWHTAEAVVDPDSTEHAIQANATDGVLERKGGLSIKTGLSANTDYPLALVLRETGAYLYARINNSWTLLWIDAAGNTATLYPMFANLDGVGELDKYRVARLPGASGDTVPGNGYDVFGHRDLDVTDEIASPAEGNTFEHTADFEMTFDLDTLPSALDLRVLFRIQNAVTDYWRIQCKATGDFVLQLVENSSATTKGTASGVLSGGEKITLVVSGPTIRGYYDNTLAWTVSESTGLDSLTDGEVDSLGTGGVISNLALRTLDGVANVDSPNHPGYGIATDVLPGPRAALDAFTHEADGIIEWTISGVPATNEGLRFRIKDSNNLWAIAVAPTGSVTLYETVGGSSTSKASTGGGVVTGACRGVIVLDGETIKCYIDTTLVFTYSSAANFKTETAGKVGNASTTISNVIAWPRSLAAAPNTPGAEEAKAALDAMSA